MQFDEPHFALHNFRIFSSATYFQNILNLEL
jgi:hypothetical protein